MQSVLAEQTMEKLVIQSDIGNISFVENFVRAICDRNHIVNYYATISVSVIKAVENAIRSGSSSELSVLSSHCRGGITFTIQCTTPCFSSVNANNTNWVPSIGSPEESVYLISVLCDQVKVADGGCSIQMTFNVRGIDVEEAFDRVQLLEHFYGYIRIGTDMNINYGG